MTKKGAYRLKAYYDFEGDYTVAIQEYRGFFFGWKTVSCVYAIHGRNEEEAIRVATQRMQERAKVRTGVVGVLS